MEAYRTYAIELHYFRTEDAAKAFAEAVRGYPTTLSAIAFQESDNCWMVSVKRK